MNLRDEDGKVAARRVKKLNLTIPIFLCGEDLFKPLEKNSRENGLLRPKYITGGTALFSILTGEPAIFIRKKVWRKHNQIGRGMLLTHELLHILLRHQPRDRKTHLSKEELVRKLEPKLPLVALKKGNKITFSRRATGVMRSARECKNT